MALKIVHSPPRVSAVMMAMACLGSAIACAATQTPSEQRYLQDRANCLAGNAAESQKTCLVEAAAALQAARQHDLTTPAAEEIVANERKRCEAKSGSDRRDCLKRVAGVDTTVTGSVASGGDLKETVTDSTTTRVPVMVHEYEGADRIGLLARKRPEQPHLRVIDEVLVRHVGSVDWFCVPALFRWNLSFFDA